MNVSTKTLHAAAVSATVAVIMVTVVTIGSELLVSFKSWLASLTGHHWVTKSLMAAILFPLIWVIASGFLRRGISNEAVRRSLWLLIAAALFGFGAILGFYIWHYF